MRKVRIDLTPRQLEAVVEALTFRLAGPIQEDGLPSPTVYDGALITCCNAQSLAQLREIVRKP